MKKRRGLTVFLVTALVDIAGAFVRLFSFFSSFFWGGRARRDVICIFYIYIGIFKILNSPEKISSAARRRERESLREGRATHAGEKCLFRRFQPILDSRRAKIEE